jgi:hypothetical protein
MTSCLLWGKACPKSVCHKAFLDTHPVQKVYVLMVSQWNILPWVAYISCLILKRKLASWDTTVCPLTMTRACLSRLWYPALRLFTSLRPLAYPLCKAIMIEIFLLSHSLLSINIA